MGVDERLSELRRVLDLSVNRLNDLLGQTKAQQEVILRIQGAISERAYINTQQQDATEGGAVPPSEPDKIIDIPLRE